MRSSQQNTVDERVVSSDVVCTHHIHNILLTAPQFNISQKALGKLPEDSNVMPKHVEVTIQN
jgi:predicted RNA methylase